MHSNRHHPPTFTRLARPTFTRLARPTFTRLARPTFTRPARPTFTWLVGPALALLLGALTPLGAVAQAPLPTAKLQQVGGEWFVVVDVPPPADWQRAEGQAAAVLSPRLVPQAGTIRAVYPQTPGSLRFLGRVVEPAGSVRLLLHYPTDLAEPRWAERPIELDLGQVPRLAAAERPGVPGPKGTGDLAALWALAAARDAQTREALAGELEYFQTVRRLLRARYGADTGLALAAGPAAPEPAAARTIPIAQLPPLAPSEVPWPKLLAGKQVPVEPAAKLVPADQYYVRVSNVGALTELIGRLGTLVGPITGFLANSDRDSQWFSRYQRELALPTGNEQLGKVLGPLVVRELLITGSDLNWPGGADLTMLFGANNAFLLRLALDGQIKTLQREYGAELVEQKADWLGVTIRSWRSADGLVNAHRAEVAEWLILSNSATAIRRVIETIKGKRAALADEPDFRYQRLLFPLNEPEATFVCLSESFLRRQFSPLLQVQTWRRDQAVGLMREAAHAALWVAVQTGKLPADPAQLHASSGLAPLPATAPPDFRYRWDSQRRMVRSDIYGSPQCPAVAVDVPVDRVTPTEVKRYNDLRQELFTTARVYIGSTGIRTTVTDAGHTIQTRIVPANGNFEQDALRRRLGGPIIGVDPADFNPPTVAQAISHVSPQTPERQLLLDFLRNKGIIPPAPRAAGWLGDWAFVRVESTPELAAVVDGLLLMLEAGETPTTEQLVAALGRVQWSAGLEIHRPVIFGGVLLFAREAIGRIWPDLVDWRAVPAYRNVPVTRVQLTPRGMELVGLVVRDWPAKAPPPAFYYCQDGNAWYVSSTPQGLFRIIDRLIERKQGKGPMEVIPVNTSIFAGMRAVDADLQGVLQKHAARKAQRRARCSAAGLEPLAHAGLWTDTTTLAQRQRLELALLGAVVASPQADRFRYDPRRGEVSEATFGSWSRPTGQAKLDEAIQQLMRELAGLRLDARWYADGAGFTLTILRSPQPKQ